MEINKLQERVIKAQWKPGCWLLVSGSRKDPRDTFGAFYAKATVSFLFDSGEVSAEWEPEYGPIQVWHKCHESTEGAKEHYFYDFTNDSPGNWSQLAVEENELPQAFVDGNYDYIFSVLEIWAR